MEETYNGFIFSSGVFSCWDTKWNIFPVWCLWQGRGSGPFCPGDSLLFPKGHLMSIFTSWCQFLSFFILARKAQQLCPLKSPLPPQNSLFSRLSWLVLKALSSRFPQQQHSEALSPECVLVIFHSGWHFLLSLHPPWSLFPLPPGVHFPDGFVAGLPYFLTLHNFNFIMCLASYLGCSPGWWLLLFTLVLRFMTFVFPFEDVWANLELSSYCYSPGIWSSHKFEIWNAWYRSISRNPSIYKWEAEKWRKPICPALYRTELKTVALPTSHCSPTKSPFSVRTHSTWEDILRAGSLGVSTPTLRTWSL